MDPKYWSRPVTFAEKVPGRYKTITNTEQAARALSEQWPANRGRRYRKARQVCMAVLEGKRLPSEARQAFLDAAAEADVVIRQQ